MGYWSWSYRELRKSDCKRIRQEAVAGRGGQAWQLKGSQGIRTGEKILEMFVFIYLRPLFIGSFFLLVLRGVLSSCELRALFSSCASSHLFSIHFLALSLSFNFDNKHQQIKAIHIHAELMSVENGLLTPTFKAKRSDVEKVFQPTIRKLYDETNKNQKA